ncbi:MAG: PKD domain-containing protein, partial [Alphaproteobacteria bacterium]
MGLMKVGFVMLMSATLLAACSSNSGSSAGGASSQSSLVGAASLKAAQASVNGPQAGMVGNALSFSLTFPAGSSAADVSWNFGDGSTAVSGAGPVSHTYQRAGNYQLVVTTHDASGAVASIAHPMAIVGFMDGMECLPELAMVPVADATVGIPVNLRVVIPECLSGAISSITWNYGDGSNAGSGANVQ